MAASSVGGGRARLKAYPWARREFAQGKVKLVHSLRYGLVCFLNRTLRGARRNFTLVLS